MDNAAAFSIETEQRDGVRRLRLSGRITLADGAPLWSQLGRLIDGEAARPAGAAANGAVARDRLELDVAGVSLLDGGGAALLLAATSNAVEHGRDVRIVGADGEVARLLQLYDCPPGQQCLHPAPRKLTILEQIGTAAVEVARQGRQVLAFTGDLIVGVLQAVRRPRSVHFADLTMLMERAGADGLPIVAVIHFLIGTILGLQGAIQLHRFGADPYLASLVGLSVVRELGPLMTAILVAGRSGASYAAELGTMEVGEEVAALRTLGQDPQRFLVFPRVLALLVVVPLLTAFADLVACLGGMFIAIAELSLSPKTYLRMLQEAVDVSDVMTGLIKSAAFAALIGLVACQRGLSTRGGAQGVGASTTSAVVVVLFGLVALDAVFTLIFRLLGW